MRSEKYQIFVSSTYEDLKEERNMALYKILKLHQIPAGMEWFSANGEEQFRYIKEVLDGCSYFVLIIKGKYGSLNREGISYTEAEFDYARKRGIRVLAFLYDGIDDLPVSQCENLQKGRRRHHAFVEKVKRESGLVVFWNDIKDLESKLGDSLANVMREFPATTRWRKVG